MTLSQLEFFHRDFEIELGLNEEQKQASYRIRYQVYCEERNLEACDDSIKGLENDEFDPVSIPILIKHKASGNYIGTMRIVYVHQKFGLPIEQKFQNAGVNSGLSYVADDHEHVVEISRLAVPRYIDTLGLVEAKRNEILEVGKMFSNALYYSACCYIVHLSNIQNACAIMEQRLFRRLRQVGLNFIQQSEFVEFKGPRASFNIEREDIANAISDVAPNFVSKTTESFCKQLVQFANTQSDSALSVVKTA